MLEYPYCEAFCYGLWFPSESCVRPLIPLSKVVARHPVGLSTEKGPHRYPPCFPPPVAANEEQSSGHLLTVACIEAVLEAVWCAGNKSSLMHLLYAICVPGLSPDGDRGTGCASVAAHPTIQHVSNRVFVPLLEITRAGRG